MRRFVHCLVFERLERAVSFGSPIPSAMKTFPYKSEYATTLWLRAATSLTD